MSTFSHSIPSHTAQCISDTLSASPVLQQIFNPNINQPVLHTRITHTQGPDFSCVRASISDCHFLNWFRRTLIVRKHKRGWYGIDNSTSRFENLKSAISHGRMFHISWKVWVICFLFFMQKPFFFYVGPSWGMGLPSASTDSQATQGKAKDYK